MVDKVTWFLQDIIFSSKEQFKEAKKIIKSFGDKSRQVYDMQTWLNNINNSKYNFPEIVKGEICTGFTSIQNVRKLTEHINCENYFLGKNINRFNCLFYYEDSYNVSSYYDNIKEFLLNNNCMFVPAWTLISDYYTDFFHDYDHLISYDKKSLNGIFVRPDSGSKIFEPFVVQGPSELKVKLMDLRINKDAILVLSSEKNILHEHRFYVVDKKISTYSWYKSTTIEPHIKPMQSTFDLVEEAVKEIDMDCYTIDTCYWASGHRSCEAVVEINALATSGIYAYVNLEKLLTDVRDYCLRCQVI